MGDVVQFLPWPDPEEDHVAWAKRQTTDTLKRCWDKWVDVVDRYPCLCDEIYFEMQSRGEGRYVAV